MNEQLEHLIVLQAQDLDLARFRKDLLEAPRRVQAAQVTVDAAQKTVSTVGGALAAEEKLRRGQESEIASHKSKVARLRRSLEGATSTAQVTAFEHEIRFAESAIAKLEDDELASMERTEILDAELKRAETQATSAGRLLADERTRAATVTAEAQNAIKGIEQQRKELRAQIDPDRLATYDRLSKAKGTAIAEALGNATAGKCSACQMGVRPQRWQDLIGSDHEDEIYSCESCGRLLFWDPRRNTPRPWEAGDRLRQAQAGNQAQGSSGSPR